MTRAGGANRLPLTKIRFLRGNRLRGALAALAIVLGILVGLDGGTFAAPAEDRILPVSGYTTEKGRALARAGLPIPGPDEVLDHSEPFVARAEASGALASKY